LWTLNQTLIPGLEKWSKKQKATEEEE